MKLSPSHQRQINQSLRKQPANRWHVQQCLTYIGVDAHIRGHGRSFWSLPEWTVIGLLEQAYQLWKQKMRSLKSQLGHNHELCATLNAAWTRCKELFRKKGYELPVTIKRRYVPITLGAQ